SCASRTDRDLVAEAVEQAPCQPPRVRSATLRLLEQTFWINALGLQLMRVGANPVGHDLGRHLGVKLQAEAAARDERLRPCVGLGDDPRARRWAERVEMPLEPRPGADQVWICGPHWQPAYLSRLCLVKFGAKLWCERLAV